ncbi:tRNA uridine-5-carboxymethylaminomethyl(34) synthesis GTPase MnmE [Inquilinus sp. CAU 1745]|uniref:tRNA uridine-5-carboxymethylaminomethyl(34) synthesis GTPase MnmE n=1 Tax=Inquilinus sp. CAU 1745 TaxID=3140369 RepID=UPI00325C1EE5
MADTIYAVSTPPGRGGVAIIRVSGPDAGVALDGLVAGRRPRPRVATLGALRHPRTGELLDKALTLWFPAPGSFTGEDAAELHLHGGRAVVDGVLEALSSFPRLRVAEPGEFTRRAFANGKMDLTEAEGLADLIDAETQAQRRQALDQMGGALGRLYEGWRRGLIRVLAHLEADLDFPDEDLPEDVADQVRPKIVELLSAIEAHLADNRRGERLRSGVQIAIVGPPNAGKSSLLNVLAQRDVAIVSEVAGTTRDVIEVHLDLGGYPVILADTAGLRETSDAIEDEGVRRALHRAEAADLKLILVDARESLPRSIGDLAGDGAIIVFNKTDLLPDYEAPLSGALAVSVRTGDGLPELLALLEKKVAAAIGGPDIALTRARHREALEDCRSHLARALEAALPELSAEDVRLATRALGRITGKVDVEDLLDVIFRDFCIGK